MQKESGLDKRTEEDGGDILTGVANSSIQSSDGQRPCAVGEPARGSLVGAHIAHSRSRRESTLKSSTTEG